jgi:hypothetical protein
MSKQKLSQKHILNTTLVNFSDGSMGASQA